jgi:hypothetical protein
VDWGLEGGKAGSFSAVSFAGGVVDANGVGAGGCNVGIAGVRVAERRVGTGVGTGGVVVEGAFDAGLLGGGGRGVTFGANSPP